MRTAIFGLIGAIMLAACQPTPPPQQSAVPAVAPSSDMRSLLNAARASQGLGGVREDPALSRAARLHAEDMVAQDYFAHVGANGSRFFQRAAAAGYDCAISENIAFGQPSDAVVMQSWLDSPGHRRNIMDRRATQYGIGRAGTVWVQMFGSGC